MARKAAAALMLSLCLLLCACGRQQPASDPYGKLTAYFTDAGFACAPDDEAPVDDPAIWEASAWRALDVGGETVYVYFDESNRADYLLAQIDQERFGFTARFGLRFILNYRGDNEAVLQALRDMPQ